MDRLTDIAIGAVRASLVTFVLCGLLYPLALTGLGQLFMPVQANGSLVRGADGTIVGSRLIGQVWTGAEWFHGRPSATTPAPYNATSSGGSNLGPTSRSLAERLSADRRALEAAQPELVGRKLPADMLTASASGLDPNITPANAMLQAPRVARAHGIPVAQIVALLEQHITGRAIGLFGEPRVNVLEMNLTLQREFSQPPNRQGRR